MSYAHRVDPGDRVRLHRFQADSTAGLTREEVVARETALGAEWAALEDLLFYAGRHALLIILQGMDTSGKDGTIRRLLDFANAQSCRVEPFKVPTAEELSRDFLWRVHQKVPGRGSVAVFNRSHYEDVVIARVHGLVPESTWRRRYDHINHFERLLHDSNTIIVKLYLHITKDEQERRLLAREQDVEKAWKLSVGDWREREHWEAYQQAYEEALSRCSTEYAPWWVVPANRKWFRNLAVLERVVAALRPHREEWLASLEELGRKAKAELEAYRAGRGTAAGGR